MSSRIARPRRGAVAVLVVVMLVVLLGCTAFAIDFGRQFAFKAQLQTSADAAAMAGAIEVVLGKPETGEAAAIEYGQKNLVETVLPTIASADVEPGSWNDATKAFDRSSWIDPSINAVRVTAHHTVNYFFAPVLGIKSSAISATAIGALGAVTTSSCVKPWAVPYANLLRELGRPYGTPEDMEYDLTEDDIAALRAKTIADNMDFKVGAAEKKDTGNFNVPGNFYAVRFPPIEYADGSAGAPKGDPGGDVYEKNIAGCSGDPIAIGDWLQAENGAKVGKTVHGVELLCGGALGPGGQCSPNRNIIVPVVAEYRLGGLPEFRVKYIGGFVLTQVKGPTVSGYLDSFNYSGGTWTPGGIGPITRAVLVR